MIESSFPEEIAFRYCDGFSIGGVSVGIDGAGDGVALDRKLRPFRARLVEYDIFLRFEVSAEIPRMDARKLFDSGTTWRLYQDECSLRFDFEDPSRVEQPYKRLRIDSCFRQANLQLREQFFLDFPVEPFGYPLDELLIMHRLTQERAIELHGTGIVRGNGVANLFVGHSGAGKSTTTRLWTAMEDVEVLSDDRIIVRADDERQVARRSGMEIPGGAAGVANKQEVLRLRDCSPSGSNHFAQDDKSQRGNHFAQDDRVQGDGIEEKRVGRDNPGHNIRMYGTPWHGEAMFASPNSTPLTRIFVLEHGHGNTITRLTKSQAVGELFARAFVPFHRHEYIENALSFLEQLTESVPCYRYDFEPDERAVKKIQKFED
jgi:hypothetical protein